MVDFASGLDCAGFVAGAILEARHVTRSAARLREPVLEDLSNLEAIGYKKVAADAPLREGDVLAFGPPPSPPGNPRDVGHRAIVSLVCPAGDDVAYLTRTLGRRLSPEAAASGRWLKVVVDSSWGNGGDPLLGRVRRRTWRHEPTHGARAPTFYGRLSARDPPYAPH